MSLNFDEIRRDLHWLRGEDGVVPAQDAVAGLARVLEPLLGNDGYKLRMNLPRGDGGVDLVAERPAENGQARVLLGIEYKHYGHGRPIGVSVVRDVIGAALLNSFNRVMVVGRFGFTRAAIQAADRTDPLAIQLLDLNGIQEWISRLQHSQPDYAAKVEILVRSISHEFARLVAEDPRALDHLEWRDLERMMARVMEGLGFRVTLTPPSKDGGKDLVLTCEVSDQEHSFIVELKHWRAGAKVGKTVVKAFLNIVVAERRSGGLFLSTSGYTRGAFEGLTEIERRRLRFGDQTKLVLLTQTYVRAVSGLWSPPAALPEILFEGTV
jgi:hypothetical protein